jgi:hypothetical protein
MKLPSGLLDKKGASAKGSVVLTSHTTDTNLEEFGVTVNADDCTASCYVLAKSEDIIEVHFALNPNVADFVDIIVDGIRRRTFENGSQNITFRAKCDRVLYMRRCKNNKRGGLRYSRMQVRVRETGHSKIQSVHDLKIYY